MKIIFFLYLLLGLGLANEAGAQISTSQIRSVSKQVKQANSAAKNASSGLMLSQLDEQLRQKFRLDAVKSELSGETLRVKAASAAFARLPAASQNAHGARILEGAVTMLGAQKSTPVKTLVVDLVQDITVGNAIKSFSRQVK
jgi:hypothetical protein